MWFQTHQNWFLCKIKANVGLTDRLDLHQIQLSSTSNRATHVHTWWVFNPSWQTIPSTKQANNFSLQSIHITVNKPTTIVVNTIKYMHLTCKIYEDSLASWFPFRCSARRSKRHKLNLQRSTKFLFLQQPSNLVQPVPWWQHPTLYAEWVYKPTVQRPFNLTEH